MKRYPSKPKPMPTSTSFDIRPRHVVTIDLHGLSVAEARAKLKQVLEHCPKTVTEVEVIHGYHSGQALQKPAHIVLLFLLLLLYPSCPPLSW